MQPWPPLVRSVVLIALLTLGTVATAPVAAQDDAFEEWSRARLGDPATDPPYAVTLWSETAPHRVDPERPPQFLFVLSWRANGSRVVPGPDLQIFAFLCAPTDDVEVPCDPEVEAATEVGYLVQDGGAAAPDGTYLWQPDPERLFTQGGEWRVRVNLADEPAENAATFVLATINPLSSTPPIIAELLERLFGTDGGILSRVAVMLLWLAVFFFIGRFVAHTARRTFLSPSRVDPTVGKLAVRLFAAVWGIIAIAWALWVVWRVNFWAGLTALGLLSVALGFGMQNTVANLMGGINLAADKPFVVGDRIQVGESWGDVQEIGLRSTKIMTPRKEVVIVPNKVLDEKEIWNYTREHQELRLDVDVGISYDSDRKLAEALMARAALDHPAVLSYPRPRVLLQDFGDFSIDLQLRCWLHAAKDARIVASDLRKAIKDAFDENGVEIPFPYRTLVNKTDLEVPHRATPQELQRLAAKEIDLPRMLYATSGPPQIHAIADFVGRIAKELDVYLVVLYVTKPGVRTSRSEQYRVFSAFQDAARAHTIPIKTLHRRGEVTDEVKRTIEDEEVELLAMGAHRQAIIPVPSKMADFTKEVRRSADIPVLIVPRSLQIGERTLDHYRRLVEKRHLTKMRKRGGIVSDQDADGIPKTKKNPRATEAIAGDEIDLNDVAHEEEGEEEEGTDTPRGPGGGRGG